MRAPPVPRTLPLLVGCLLVLSGGAALADYTVVVAADGTGDYTTIQDALEALETYPPGEHVEVLVREGTYYGPFAITREHTSLIADSGWSVDGQGYLEGFEREVIIELDAALPGPVYGAPCYGEACMDLDDPDCLCDQPEAQPFVAIQASHVTVEGFIVDAGGFFTFFNAAIKVASEPAGSDHPYAVGDDLWGFAILHNEFRGTYGWDSAVWVAKASGLVQGNLMVNGYAGIWINGTDSGAIPVVELSHNVMRNQWLATVFEPVWGCPVEGFDDSNLVAIFNHNDVVGALRVGMLVNAKAGYFNEDAHSTMDVTATGNTFTENRNAVIVAGGPFAGSEGAHLDVRLAANQYHDNQADAYLSYRAHCECGEDGTARYHVNYEYNLIDLDGVIGSCLPGVEACGPGTCALGPPENNNVFTVFPPMRGLREGLGQRWSH